MQWDALDQEPCSMARTLSVIGDRWTLLILRDCFMKVRRFDDFHARLGIGRPILADRLQKLVDAFVLTKVAYQENPVRYEYRLTPKGLDLHPVIMSIVHWGDVHMAGRKGRPVLHRHLGCGHHFDPVLVCSQCGDPVTARNMVNEPGPGAAVRGREPVGTRDVTFDEAASVRRRASRGSVSGAGRVGTVRRSGGRSTT